MMMAENSLFHSRFGHPDNNSRKWEKLEKLECKNGIKMRINESWKMNPGFCRHPPVDVVSVFPSDALVCVVVVTLLVLGVGAVCRLVSVRVVHHRLNVLVVLTHKTLTPEANGEVGITLTDCLGCTSACGSVCGLETKI